MRTRVPTKPGRFHQPYDRWKLKNTRIRRSGSRTVRILPQPKVECFDDVTVDELRDAAIQNHSPAVPRLLSQCRQALKCSVISMLMLGVHIVGVDDCVSQFISRRGLVSPQPIPTLNTANPQSSEQSAPRFPGPNKDFQFPVQFPARHNLTKLHD